MPHFLCEYLGTEGHQRRGREVFRVLPDPEKRQKDPCPHPEGGRGGQEDGKTRKWSGKIPPNLKLPLRDGDIDRPDDENYEDCYFLNASSKDAPQVVDRKVNPVLDPMMVYSGCYCNVSVNFYAFNANGNRGVAAGLGNIQFVRDGERLSGKASADADFDALEDDDEDVLGGDLPDYLN